MRSLPVGGSAIIKSVTWERLLSLGFVPGATIILLRRSGGCLHVRVGMTEWAIRATTADFINISELK